MRAPRWVRGGGVAAGRGVWGCHCHRALIGGTDRLREGTREVLGALVAAC